jgi:hypothetical protein
MRSTVLFYAIAALVVFGFGVAHLQTDALAQSGSRTAKPAHHQTLWTWLQKHDYRQWSGPSGSTPDFEPGDSPHGALLKTYVSKKASRNLDNPPNGSVIVKENYSPEKKLMEEHPGVGIGITKLIGLRRRRLERRLRSLLFRSNRERLVLALLDLAEQYGYPTGDGIQLRVKLSHQDLANMIGSTRESVTIALGELQAARHVRVGRRKIALVDLERLARSVNAVPPRLSSIPPSPDFRSATEWARL